MASAYESLEHTAFCGQTVNIFGKLLIIPLSSCDTFHVNRGQVPPCVPILCLHHADARLEQVEQLPEGYY